MNSSADSSKAHSSSRPSTSTSRSLLLRARQDDPLAWEKLVSLYAPLVAIWCRRAGLQESDAGDVFQEVFQAVAGNLHKFRKEREGDTFRGWLRTITHNKIRDRFRKAGKEPQAAGGTEAHRRMEQMPMAAEPSESSSAGESGGDAFGQPSDEDDATAQRILFRRALELIQSNFAENTWQAFIRTAVDGQSSTDIADELGMSPGAVRVAKSRVLQRLREELGDLL